MAWFRADSPSASAVLSARECAAAAVSTAHGSPIIVITFGNDANARFKDVVELDPRTLTFSKHASAQNPQQPSISAHTCATADGRFLYCCGGWDGSRDQSQTNRYDSLLRCWDQDFTVSGEIPSPRHFHSCVAVGRLLILAFGFDGSIWTGDLYAFDTLTHKWARIKPAGSGSMGGEGVGHDEGLVPEPRASHHAVALDDRRMALFAGFDGESFLSDLWILHVEPEDEEGDGEEGGNNGEVGEAGQGQLLSLPGPGSKTQKKDSGALPYRFRWERIERPAPGVGAAGAANEWAEPRSGGCMIQHRGCLVVYGGRCRRDGKVSFSDTVEAFSFVLRRWVRVASTGSVPSPRKCFSFAHVGSRLWVMGGLGQSTTYFSDVHALDLDVTLELAFPELFSARVPRALLSPGVLEGGSLHTTRITVPASTHRQDAFCLVLSCFSHVLPSLPKREKLTDDLISQVAMAQELLAGNGKEKASPSYFLRRAFLEALTSMVSPSSSRGASATAVAGCASDLSALLALAGVAIGGDATILPVTGKHGQIMDGSARADLSIAAAKDKSASEATASDGEGAAYTDRDFQAYFEAAAVTVTADTDRRSSPSRAAAIASRATASTTTTARAATPSTSSTTVPAGGEGEPTAMALAASRTGTEAAAGPALLSQRPSSQEEPASLSRRDHPAFVAAGSTSGSLSTSPSASASATSSSSSAPAPFAWPLFRSGDHHSLVASAVNADVLVEIENTDDSGGPSGGGGYDENAHLARATSETTKTVVVPLHRGILASRCPFFATLLSERWHPASPSLSEAGAAVASTTSTTAAFSGIPAFSLAANDKGNVNTGLEPPLWERPSSYRHQQPSSSSSTSSSPSMASSLPTIRLGEMSLTAFFQLVHYVYTDCLPLYPRNSLSACTACGKAFGRGARCINEGCSSSNAASSPLPFFDVGEQGLELLAQASKLDLQRLSLFMQACLEVFISEDTVCSILQAADSLEAVALRASALRYILANFDKVTVHPSFVALPEPLLREILVRRSKAMQPSLALAAASVASSVPSSASPTHPSSPFSSGSSVGGGGSGRLSRQPSTSSSSVPGQGQGYGHRFPPLPLPLHTTGLPAPALPLPHSTAGAPLEGGGSLLSPSLFAAVATSQRGVRAAPPLPPAALNTAAANARAAAIAAAAGHGGGGSPVISGLSGGTPSAGVTTRAAGPSALALPPQQQHQHQHQHQAPVVRAEGRVPGFPPSPPATSTAQGRRQQHHQGGGGGGEDEGGFEYEDAEDLGDEEYGDAAHHHHHHEDDEEIDAPGE